MSPRKGLMMGTSIGCGGYKFHRQSSKSTRLSQFQLSGSLLNLCQKCLMEASSLLGNLTVCPDENHSETCHISSGLPTAKTTASKNTFIRIETRAFYCYALLFACNAMTIRILIATDTALKHTQRLPCHEKLNFAQVGCSSLSIRAP